MFRKIMVGYVAGERGADALALARVLASAESVRDVLIVEAQPVSGKRHEGEPGEARARLTTQDWPPGVKVGVKPEHGESTAQTLAAVADREAADLVVLGSTHRGFAGRVLMGTTAGSLLPEATCTVVVAPAGYARSPAPLGEIALAYDGSDEAQAALEWAADVASAMSAHLRLVGIVAPAPPIDTWAAGVPAETWSGGLSYAQTVEIADAQRERMSRELEAAAASVGTATTATTTVVGDPQRELRSAAEEVDMLVVGSHRHGALASVLFGSVSRGLAHSCPAPLAVVPNAPRGPQEGGG
jgi:nucleotide-binding universal stress UspA family protein